MNENEPLTAGLYLVATPIGNARDITLRALDILAKADILAAEDTRTARKLLEIHGLGLGGRPLIAYHDHSGQRGRDGLVKLVREGKSLAYVSEAGMPLIADPGFALARDMRAHELPVTVIPGASAVLTGLAISGLPTDRFLFAGFPPAQDGARKRWLAELVPVAATLVLYESPKRVHRTLTALVQTGFGARQMSLCRELTKRYEEVLRGSVADLAEELDGRDLKGEIVLVIDRGVAAPEDVPMEAALRRALEEMSLKEAVAVVTEAYGLPRRRVYQAALELEKEE